MLHEVIAFCDQLHIPVLDPVVDHFHVVTSSIRTDVSHTWFSIFWCFCRDFFKNICYQFIGFFLSTRHDRRTFKGTFFTTRNPCTDKVDTRVCQLFVPTDGIFVESISSVNQDIAFIQMWKKGLDSCICTRSCLNHEHDTAWFFDRVYKAFDIIAWHKVLFRMASNNIFCFFFTTVINGNCIATRFNIKGKVTTHYGHTNNTKVCFSHVTLLFIVCLYSTIFPPQKKAENSFPPSLEGEDHASHLILKTKVPEKQFSDTS